MGAFPSKSDLNPHISPRSTPVFKNWCLLIWENIKCLTMIITWRTYNLGFGGFRCSCPLGKYPTPSARIARSLAGRVSQCGHGSSCPTHKLESRMIRAKSLPPVRASTRLAGGWQYYPQSHVRPFGFELVARLATPVVPEAPWVASAHPHVGRPSRATARHPSLQHLTLGTIAVMLKMRSRLAWHGSVPRDAQPLMCSEPTSLAQHQVEAPAPALDAPCRCRWDADLGILRPPAKRRITASCKRTHHFLLAAERAKERGRGLQAQGHSQLNLFSKCV